MSPPIIHFDYSASPYASKTSLALTLTSTPFKSCPQPPVLPRPDLLRLGVTYRRIPLLAIGKDIYCDSSLILSKISQLASSSNGCSNLPSTPADRAYQAWGDTVFQESLGLVPPEILTEKFVKDRVTVFPILAREDYAELGDSAKGVMKARLREVEEEFLSGEGKFIGGKREVGWADVHVVWVVKRMLKGLGAEKEGKFGKGEFPKIWEWIGGMPEGKAEGEIGGEEAERLILGGGYSDEGTGPEGVMAGEVLEIEKGREVHVESLDSKPGSHPQAGKFVASSIDEVVVELENGIRVHFPRIGYIVKPR